MLPRALALLLGAVVLAGCTAPSPPEPPAPVPPGQGPPADEPVTPSDGQLPPPEERPHSVQVFPFQGKLTLAAGSEQVGYLNPTGSAGDAHLFDFDVQPGALAIIAEVRWDDPMADLDLVLQAPTCDPVQGNGTCLWHTGGSAGAGDSPIRVVVDDAALLLNESGAWRLGVWAKDAVNTDFDVVVSVFYGLPPAEDYTAWA